MRKAERPEEGDTPLAAKAKQEKKIISLPSSAWERTTSKLCFVAMEWTAECGIVKQSFG